MHKSMDVKLSYNARRSNRFFLIKNLLSKQKKTNSLKWSERWDNPWYGRGNRFEPFNQGYRKWIVEKVQKSFNFIEFLFNCIIKSDKGIKCNKIEFQHWIISAFSCSLMKLIFFIRWTEKFLHLMLDDWSIGASSIKLLNLRVKILPLSVNDLWWIHLKILLRSKSSSSACPLLRIPTCLSTLRFSLLSLNHYDIFWFQLITKPEKTKLSCVGFNSVSSYHVIRLSVILITLHVRNRFYFFSV